MIYNLKIPKISALPVPAPSPKIFKTCPRPHPVPGLRGNPRGPPGIGGTVPLTSYNPFRILLRRAKAPTQAAE